MKGLSGSIKEINHALVVNACHNTPSLIVDSSRACNPYSIVEFIDIESLHDVYIISAESIYRFRSAIKLLPLWIKKYDIKNVYITVLTAFYSYENKIEDYSILEESYELLSRIDGNVIVSLPLEEPYYSIIRKYCSEIISG
jgi:hypothetical protein